MRLPLDYPERVYAGVLGKIIGVYLGRPFEGWTHDRISQELGEISYYVNDRLPWNPPLIVTDDDITGTFTFLKALPDNGNPKDLTPAQIGQTWLNYIIENRTILWWGGLGNSTEHTAYLRLKDGCKPPESGSIARNGPTVAEQIGAQIFIDGWAMVAPGDPEFAADLARRAASVSHDGEAIYGAQVLAAMESQAFVEADIHKLLDVGTSLIPPDSTIYRMIADLREWQDSEADWRKTFRKIQEIYGYDRFSGNVHIVPNHALVILGLLYSNDDFQTAMRVVNSAGWDTDCNSGNLGCLMGIKNGLAGLRIGPDWRSPVADRLYLPTAEGGEAITDAVIESIKIVNIGRALQGEAPFAPKTGARFNFWFPGSLQGFQAEGANTWVENVSGHSRKGERSLAIHFRETGRAATPTFILPEELDMPGYPLMACPTLYSGQTVTAGLCADGDLSARLFLRVYNHTDQLDTLFSPYHRLENGLPLEVTWQVPDTGGQPVAQVGVEASGSPDGTLVLDYLTWEGEPDIRLARPEDLVEPSQRPSHAWRRAWVDGMDQWLPRWQQAYRFSQNAGRGLLIQGTRQWQDCEVEASIRTPLAAAAGIAVRVQGMRRYYALLLIQGDKLRLVKVMGDEIVLADMDYPWEFDRQYDLRLQADGNRLLGWVDGAVLFDVKDEGIPLEGGAAAFVLEEGHMMSDCLTVRPFTNQRPIHPGA
jgi:ADP-ribosylglycohydrolase